MYFLKPYINIMNLVQHVFVSLTSKRPYSKLIINLFQCTLKSNNTPMEATQYRSPTQGRTTRPGQRMDPTIIENHNHKYVGQRTT